MSGTANPKSPAGSGHQNAAFEPDATDYIEPVMIDDQQTSSKRNTWQNGGRDNAAFESDDRSEPAILQVNHDNQGYLGDGYGNPSHHYQGLVHNNGSTMKGAQSNGAAPSEYHEYAYPEFPGGPRANGVETGQDAYQYENPNYMYSHGNGNDLPYGFNRANSYKYTGQTEAERTAQEKKEKKSSGNKWTCVCVIFFLVLFAAIIGAIIFVVFEFVINKPSTEVTSQAPPTTTSLPISSMYLVTSSAVATLDLQFDPALQDPTSSEYQDLETDFKNMMDSAFQGASLNGSYEEVIVSSFSSGSVLVDFTVVISASVADFPGAPMGNGAELIAFMESTVGDEVNQVLSDLTADNSSSLPLVDFDVTDTVAEPIVTSTEPLPTTELPNGVTSPQVPSSANPTTMATTRMAPTSLVPSTLPIEETTHSTVTTVTPIPECQPHETLCVNGVGCVGFDEYCDGVVQCLDGSDELYCTDVNCTSDELPCADQTECYLLSESCDGALDCTDGSDELFCCPFGETSCNDGINCYPAAGYCDGNPDCVDGSDEQFCSQCPTGQTLCYDGIQCYDLSGYCDGIEDCLDGSDELLCGSFCPVEELYCSDGNGCYTPGQLCDGVTDCADESDESFCLGNCESYELLCDSGDACYNMTLRCDGIQDCPDQSDERNCTAELEVIYLDDQSGLYTWSSPGYPNRYPLNAFRSWLFVASSGNRPQVDFADIYTEPTMDVLRLYAGPSASGESLELSGALTRSGVITYRSNNESLYATFTTDFAVSVRGFSGLVRQVAANTDLTCASDQYDCADGMVCMPSDQSCSCPLPPDECTPPPDCFSCDSGKCIPFDQECDGEHQCEFGEDERDCDDRCEGFLCDDGICIEMASICDNIRDCTGGEDEFNCTYPVGEETVYLFYGLVTELVSYGYPDEYPNNVQYTWKINAGTEYKIRMHFYFFSTHDANDYVVMGDGDVINTSPFLRLYGGGFVPEEVLSQGGDLWVTMVTDRTLVSSGFRANMTVVPDNELLPSCRPSEVRCGDHVCIPAERLCDVTPHCLNPSFDPGCPARIHMGGVSLDYASVPSPYLTIYSENYPSRYDNNVNATLYLTTQSGRHILAATRVLDIEEDYDFVRIYDGHGAGQLLAELSGLVPNQVFVSTTNEMTVVFQTDYAYAFPGFWLEVESKDVNGCADDEFACMNGQCRPASAECNGVVDCVDFTDEDRCPVCESVPSECSAVLPWSTTIFPNARFASQAAALGFYASLAPYLSSCGNPSAEFLLCAASFPECPHYGPGRIPCESVCESVVTDCPSLAGLSEICRSAVVPVEESNGVPLCEAREGDVFNTTVCGTRPAYHGETGGASPRIIGGTFAETGEFPWIGSLLDGDGALQCGATLLTERWAVTAAHCTGYYNKIVFGDLQIDTPSNYSVSPTIAEIIDHPDYYSTTGGSDITLIRFEDPIMFNDYVRPLCLPITANVSETSSYRRCYAAGWGTLQFEGYASNDLLKVLLKLLENDVCAQGYDDIISSKICAGYPTGGYDACQGDSGGPLACEGDDGRWHLVGITSYGNLGCGDPGFPGVYTRVSSFLDFINLHISAFKP